MFDHMVKVTDGMPIQKLLTACSLEKNMEDLDDEDMLVNITIRGGMWPQQERRFCLPIQVIVSREKDMHVIAKSRSDEWTESFIMRKVKASLRKIHTGKFREKSIGEDWYSFNHELPVTLDIDKVSHQSDNRYWGLYLIDSIRKYYATGEITITESMLNEGYDVQLAFGCLGIIYDEKVITFDNFVTSLRSKACQLYNKKRVRIAKWVERELQSLNNPHHIQQTMAFVASPMRDGFDVFLCDASIHCEVLGLGLKGVCHDGTFKKCIVKYQNKSSTRSMGTPLQSCQFHCSCMIPVVSSNTRSYSCLQPFR